jgi:hypothetical protein
MSFTKTISATGASLLLSLSLFGCAGAEPPTSAQERGTSEASAAPDDDLPEADQADSDPAPVDPNLLFTISVTATSPEGAIAQLVQRVYKPVAATAAQVADEAALDGECDGWRTRFPSASFVVSAIDITDLSPSGASWDGAVTVASMNGWPVFTGEVSSFQAYCASDQFALGASRGVTPVDAAASADAAGGWASIEYGFGIATDFMDEEPFPGYTHFTNCTIELSQYAVDNSAIAAAWPTSVQEYPSVGCMFGEGGLYL